MVSIAVICSGNSYGLALSRSERQEKITVKIAGQLYAEVAIGKCYGLTGQVIARSALAEICRS